MKNIIPLITILASLTTATGYHSAATDNTNSFRYTSASDSDMDISDISEAASDDAQEFFTSHNSKRWHDDALTIGIAHGIKNGYKGQAAYLYADYFYSAFDALYKDQ
jgi:hypothetical protein